MKNDEEEFEEEDEFELYNLNIPSIFKIENAIEEQIFMKLTSQLQSFSEGTHENPGEGYIQNKSKFDLSFIQKFSYLEQQEKNITIIKYHIEKYSSERIFDKNNKKIVKRIRKDIGVNYIILLKPDLIIVQGARDTVRRFINSYDYIFRTEKIKLKNQIMFDKWFLIWIIDQYRQKNFDLSPDLSLDLIEDINVIGEKEALIGKDISAKKSTDATRSLSILFPLLKGLLPIGLKLCLTIKDILTTLYIESSGKMKIYLSKGTFEEKANETRILLGSFAIEKIIRLYDDWLKKPILEKIPSSNFISNIVKECNNKGIEIATNIAGTLEMYKNKRKE